MSTFVTIPLTSIKPPNLLVRGDVQTYGRASCLHTCSQPYGSLKLVEEATASPCTVVRCEFDSIVLSTRRWRTHVTSKGHGRYEGDLVVQFTTFFETV